VLDQPVLRFSPAAAASWLAATSRSGIAHLTAADSGGIGSADTRREEVSLSRVDLRALSALNRGKGKDLEAMAARRRTSTVGG
jgi:hypothetical protein